MILTSSTNGALIRLELDNLRATLADAEMTTWKNYGVF